MKFQTLKYTGEGKEIEKPVAILTITRHKPKDNERMSMVLSDAVIALQCYLEFEHDWKDNPEAPLWISKEANQYIEVNGEKIPYLGYYGLKI